MSRLEYLLDELLSGDMQERSSIIADCGKEVKQIERRMEELAVRAAAGREKHGREHRAAPER